MEDKCRYCGHNLLVVIPSMSINPSLALCCILFVLGVTLTLRLLLKS